MRLSDASEPLPVSKRIASIEAACATPLGFAMRGVASWEQDWLAERRDLVELPFLEEVRLQEIEEQVFGHAGHRAWCAFP